jgi:uncharacterized protein (TIGR04255 family)
VIEVPEVALPHLDQAPLKLALVQVRYTPVHAVEKRDLVADFEDAVDARYIPQDPEYAQTFTIQVGPGPAPMPTPPAPSAEVVWRFQDEERGLRISLSSSSLALESIDQYEDFPSFSEEFGRVLQGFAAVFNAKRRLRLGLRYVNEVADPRLSDPATGVAHFVNSELISPIGGRFGNDLLSSLSELRLREGLGSFVVRHGLVEPEKYLLDYDYYAEDARPFDPGEILDRVVDFHDLIERVFVWSLSDAYLAELRQREGE